MFIVLSYRLSCCKKNSNPTKLGLFKKQPDLQQTEERRCSLVSDSHRVFTAKGAPGWGLTLQCDCLVGPLALYTGGHTAPESHANPVFLTVLRWPFLSSTDLWWRLDEPSKPSYVSYMQLYHSVLTEGDVASKGNSSRDTHPCICAQILCI